MRFSFLGLISSIFLIVACNSVDPKFPREETLIQELMPLQGINNPFNVEIKHPFLILQNHKRDDSLFHIYNLNGYELKSAFGVSGRDPDEFVIPWLLNTGFPEVLIDDEGKRLIHSISIDENGQPAFISQKRVRFNGNICQAAFISDSLFVLDAEYLAPSLYLLSFDDELPRKVKQFRNPDIMDYYADPDMASVIFTYYSLELRGGSIDPLIVELSWRCMI